MKKIILGIVLLGIFGTAFYGYDHRRKFRTGYCFVEKRYLSDTEIIEPAIEGLVRRLDRFYNSLPLDKQAEYIHYRDVGTFKRLNPGCCERQFSEVKKRPTKRQMISMKQTGRFTFNWHIKIKEREDKPNFKREVNISVDSCGTLRRIDLLVTEEETNQYGRCKNETNTAQACNISIYDKYGWFEINNEERKNDR